MEMSLLTWTCRDDATVLGDYVLTTTTYVMDIHVYLLFLFVTENSFSREEVNHLLIFQAKCLLCVQSSL